MIWRNVTELGRAGIDLKAEMDKRLLALEELHKKEKEEADQMFAEQRKNYEAQIDALQRKVEEQSMTMSMYRYMYLQSPSYNHS